MSDYPKSYDNLSNIDKKTIISNLYTNKLQSFADIAELFQTYSNRIRRDAKSFGIPIRTRSEAQKNALQVGNHKHPTKGTKRDNKTKQKIGRGVLESWDNLSSLELENRKEAGRKQWLSKSEDDKANLIKLANEGVRKASKTGSKLEKYLLSRLLGGGYKVEFHKEQSLLTTKLQIDLFIPSINTAIEVDGPSHFLPVWGTESLKRNISYDNKKQGLVLGRGMVLIRIKQEKDFSETRGDMIYAQLNTLLVSISGEFPKPDNRIFIIEDTNG